jgi:thymidylate synthase (FAD)
MKVTLVSKTVGVGQLEGLSPKDIAAYCARVSNPSNQSNFETSGRLLQYCFKHGHVSVFEMADFTFEIVTSRAIAAQILRHRHFNFQEFSQRYSAAQNFERYEARLQDTKNKQNSLDTDDFELKTWFDNAQSHIEQESMVIYEEALAKGIAKEQARFVLPMSVQTTLYMKGSLRSWIHYLALRLNPATQKEHRAIALEIYNLLLSEIPDILPLVEGYSIIENNPYD